MNELEEYRAEIDKIDKELVALFEKRMDAVLKVAEYKKKNNMQIFHKDREDIVIDKVLKDLKNKDYSKEIVEFFNNLMHISKEYQRKKISKNKLTSDICIERGEILKKKVVGFPGVKGAFTEEAAIHFFGEDSIRQEYEEFEDVFKALEKGEIYYGIIPLENSSTGAVSVTYDLLRKYNFYIIGEECLKVEQHLVGVSGAKVEDIKEVYSHAQGIAQCSGFLKNYSDWKLIPYHNTATSAKFVRDLGDKSKAAIASERAAKIYGLDIIKSGINDESENNTRFIVISKELRVVNDADKISVMFSLENEAGTLYRLLSFFAKNNLNMIKIESRPVQDTPWKYFLYVDFEGNIESEEVVTALRLIKKNSAYFKMLGSYKKKI